jgi:hypothetical protein
MARLGLLALAAAICCAQAAPFALAPYFTSHAVLQHGTTLPIFGTSSSGDVVTVTVGGNKYTGTADASGAWTVALPSMPATTTPTSLQITSSSGSATLTDVLFGNVFVVAGEGNVLMSASSITNATAVVASADAYPGTIRLFQAAAPAPDLRARTGAAALADAHKGHSHAKARALRAAAPSLLSSSSSSPATSAVAGLPWTPSSSAVVGAGTWTTYSAVGYLLAKALIDSTGGPSGASVVPVGIIVAAAGGSPLQAWAGPSTFSACPAAPPSTHYGNQTLFTSVLAPMGQGPLSVSGFVWWGGETNTAMAQPDTTTAWYACALPAFLAEVRATLAQPSLFVGLVQLPPVAAQFWTDAVPLFRETQRVQASATTAVVSAIDTGDILSPFTYLHSRDKAKVAARLANAALTVVYGQSGFPYVPPGAPAAAWVSTDGNNVTTVKVTFGSLAAPPLSLDPDYACPAGFPEGDPNNLWISYVCQAWRVRTDEKTGQQKWYNAEATVSPDGSGVLVTVQLPAAHLDVNLIQYAWAPWTAAQLHDANGSPVFPFEVAVTGNTAEDPVVVALSHAEKVFAKLTTLAEGGRPSTTPAAAAAAAPSRAPRRAQSWLDLEPYAWTPLPVGAVRAEGWLLRQLQVEMEGLMGTLDVSYPPVAYSPFVNVTCPWPGGCQDDNEGENFGYRFQAATPLAALADPECLTPFCQRVQATVDHLLETADPTTGWIGPPSDPNDGNAEWARWLCIWGLLQWQQSTGDARIMPAIYKHLHESYHRLTQSAPLQAWAQARAQDYVWLLQSVMDMDPTDANGEKTFLTSLMWVVAGQQGVVWEEWFTSPFFPTGNTGWNFSTQ